MPKFALARRLMLGEIPDELQQLSFAEKLLLAGLGIINVLLCCKGYA